MLFIIVILAVGLSKIETCPIFCRCYSSFDGFHITCQNTELYEIPFNLTKFLQTTEHQNLIVDLSLNFLSILPCNFLQISSIITLILTKNRIESIPLCFSQSSIRMLHLNENQLRFSPATILSSSKLLYLDLSHNHLPYLPRTFFNHLRRLRTLILNGELILFEKNNDQWIRSLTTRNQLTIIICDENFHVPLCLFNNLFQSNRLLSMEINSLIHCDCSFVYLPLEKIHFHHCKTQQVQAKCHSQSSIAESGYSLEYLQNTKYRQLCAKEYQLCQNMQLNKNDQLTTRDFDVTLSNHRLESSISYIQSSLINKSMATTMSTVTSSKKENITAGVIIPLVILLLIVTIVSLYVILSGRLITMKNREQMTNFIMRQRKQKYISNVSTGVNPTRFDDCMSIENVNMNSNPQKHSFQVYQQRKNSYSDEESELTFYSLNNNENSSTSMIQSSSMTEFDVASLTSTINSSLSSETVIVSNRNQQRIY
ncbi:unnamed protein product [Rotaria socialis]|uniref:Uncharacterized protein n=1 Tax=Rotaria socialis TaxID=392032 RepID=A0A818Q4D4_9BILA|nr:unnamed protein product [Rotaria socialis]CAF4167121.1 unnamed protein product [Rotaria socialis]